MPAAQFIGRVGGLAIAIGIGTAVAAGCAAAWADPAESPAPGSAGPRAGAASGTARAVTAGHPVRSAANGVRRRAALPAAATRPEPPAAARVARATVVPAPDAGNARVETPTPPAAVAGHGLSVAPTVAITPEGIIQGALNAVSDRGLPMTYTVLGTPCQTAVGSGDGGAGCGLGSNGGKLSIATVPVTLTVPDPQSYTILPYATWLDGGVKGTEDFRIRVSEVTAFDTFATGIPVVGALVSPVIDLLQRLPLISDLLAPIIGASVVAPIRVDVGALAPGNRQLGFTYRVTSFDGTEISTNFFPSVGVGSGTEAAAPTVLVGPGITQAGYTGPYDQAPPIPGFWPAVWVGSTRNAGYNVITWDPRGEWNSGGVLQGNNPFYEARDVSAILDWATANTPALADDTGIAAGMLGYSYGGGIQLVTAGTDNRIDAIVPEMTYNSLLQAIYPGEVYKTIYGSFFSVWLSAVGARVNPEVDSQALTGDLFGVITREAQAFFSSAGATALLDKVSTPTLLPQGTSDMLFTLQQAIQSAQALQSNPYDVPVKMFWFCGGHGPCNTGEAPDQTAVLVAARLAWLDQYVKREGTPADALPTFQWYDQAKVLHTSDLMPYDPAFATRTPVATGASGDLAIVPVLGGSSRAFSVPAETLAQFITALPAPGVAANAINVDLSADALTAGAEIVGAPRLTFNYQGLGTSNALFAQLVVTRADGTASVVGDQVSPVPVVLDGRRHVLTVPVDIANVAYTVQAGDRFTLQLTSSAFAYASISAFGAVSVSDIALTLPIVN